MKLFSKLLQISIFIFALCTFAQSDNNGTGEYKFNSNKQPCLTSEQRASIITTLKQNKTILSAENKLNLTNNSSPNPLFIWPVQKSANSIYNEVWSISGYVDHNPAYPNQLQDYDCGTKTYDTSSGYNHKGIDIYNWPFSWKMMDDDTVEVIAASNGQIIGKIDGNYDRSCDFNSNQWNAVYVRHNDGSIAWYGHIKNGSLTSKNIGDTVTQGEYLGIVGSSGNSTGPHLHFEIWENDSYTQLIDPYAGPCNNLNSQSWWQTQKPYANPAINAVLTHSNHPNFNFNNCPTTEVTYESNLFGNNETVYFYLYLRDQYVGSVVDVRIIRPDGSFLLDSSSGDGSNYTSSYWWWSRTVDMEGEWQWEATYEGQTVTHTFNVGTLSTKEFNLENTSVYPNPVEDELFIKSEVNITRVTVTDVLGKIISKVEDNAINTINTEFLSNGLYFIALTDAKNRTKTIKIIKE